MYCSRAYFHACKQAVSKPSHFHIKQPLGGLRGHDFCLRRHFSSSSTAYLLKPYLLADIGEGIVECQIISWFVKPGDTVQQFDPICEAQSDKASVEITSPYNGVVTKLHYELDAMAKVGSALVDIEVDDEQNDEAVAVNASTVQSPHESISPPASLQSSPSVIQSEPVESWSSKDPTSTKPVNPGSKSAIPILPAVRRMLKEHSLQAKDIEASGKAGRLLKEDVRKHLQNLIQDQHPTGTSEKPQLAKQDARHRLGPVEKQMFKSMTRALSIPHLYYNHVVDVTDLNSTRERYNEKSKLFKALSRSDEPQPKLRALPFIMKAISAAFTKYPNINATLDTETDPEGPELLLKGSHDFGVAMDTPKGLLVPVIRNVQSHSITSLSIEIERLRGLALENKLGIEHLQGASFVISNVGSLGGFTVGPVILAPTVAIVAVGQSYRVPGFSLNAVGEEIVVARDKMVLSWSADHRVLDGATIARCSQLVQVCLEDIGALGIILQ